MAGTITHYYFAKDVLKKSSKKRKIIFDENYLAIFAQSMDPVNFYSVLFPLKRGSDFVRKFAGVFHTQKIDDFFYNLITEVKNRNLFRDKYVMSFVYGFICHYVLDSSIHPYVEFKTGRFNPRDKKTYKYNAKHHEMETYIDAYMLRKHGIEPRKDKSYKYIFNIKKFDNGLKKLIDDTFLKVYNIQDFSKIYYRSILDMKYCFRLLRYDVTGIKLRMYKVFDVVSTRRVLNSKFLSYNVKPGDDDYYLNINHKNWYYPHNRAFSYNYSVDDIYDNAVKKCVKLVTLVFDYLERNKELDIRSLFNLSYSTGLYWKKSI